MIIYDNKIKLTKAEKEEFDMISSLYENGARILLIQKNKDEPVAFSVWTENVNKQIQDLIALIRGSTAIFIYNVMRNQISCNGEIRLEDFIANVIKGKSNVVSHLKEKGDV